MMFLAQILLLAVLAVSALPAQAMRFTFGVVPSSAMDDATLDRTLAQADANNLAFVVAQGIKNARQPCDDAVYEVRRKRFERSQHGLIPVAQSSDWAACPAGKDDASALGRLTRLRELMFQGEFSLGATRLPLVRQSTEARFHGFVENVRWEIGDVMFATINLPAPNNHFVMGAGRNGEFEDRLVANREWLHRVFTQARLQKSRAVVLFAEANPLDLPPRAKRDGFLEIRRYLRSHAAQFKGKVLIVHAKASMSEPSVIRWRENLGEIGMPNGWLRLQVDPGLQGMFTVAAKRVDQ